MSNEDIITKEIKDSSGKSMGVVTGRREIIERYNNSDYREQLKRDNERQKDRQNRK